MPTSTVVLPCYENTAFAGTQSHTSSRREPVCCPSDCGNKSAILDALVEKDFQRFGQLLSGENGVVDRPSIFATRFATPLSYCAANARKDIRYMDALRRVLRSNRHSNVTRCCPMREGDAVTNVGYDLEKYETLSNKIYILEDAILRLEQGQHFDVFVNSFELSYKLQYVLAKRYNKLGDRYQDMAEDVDHFTAELISCVDTEDELEVILHGAYPDQDPLALLRYAVKCRQRHLVSHYVTEGKVDSVWFGEKVTLTSSPCNSPPVNVDVESVGSGDRRHTEKLPVIGWKMALLLMLFTPLLWLIYLVWPFPKIKRWMDVPVRKFYVDCLLTLVFIGVLVIWASACEAGAVDCGATAHSSAGLTCTYTKLTKVFSGRQKPGASAKKNCCAANATRITRPTTTGRWLPSSTTHSNSSATATFKPHVPDIQSRTTSLAPKEKHPTNPVLQNTTTRGILFVNASYSNATEVPPNINVPYPIAPFISFDNITFQNASVDPVRINLAMSAASGILVRHTRDVKRPQPEPSRGAHHVATSNDLANKTELVITKSVVRCFSVGETAPMDIENGTYRRNGDNESIPGCFQSRHAELWNVGWIIGAFAVGLLVNEACEAIVWRIEYFKSFMNLIDVMAQICYLASLACYTLVAVRTRDALKRYELLDITMTHGPNESEAFYRNHAARKINLDLLRHANADVLYDACDPDRLGDCLFTVGTILFLIHSLQMLTEWHVLGRVYIALDYLIRCILPWGILFIWLMAAFSVSMHNLLWGFYDAYLHVDIDDSDLEAHPTHGPSYTNPLRRTFANFLWSAFGHSSPNTIKWLPEELRTEPILTSFKLHIFVGDTLLGFYNLFIVMVFFNLVIAVVNDMYNKARRRCEWQFARAVLRLKYIPATPFAPRFVSPPPLNLVPIWHHVYDFLFCLRSNMMHADDASSARVEGNCTYLETTKLLLQRLRRRYTAQILAHCNNQCNGHSGSPKVT